MMQSTFRKNMYRIDGKLNRGHLRSRIDFLTSPEEYEKRKIGVITSGSINKGLYKG